MFFSHLIGCLAKKTFSWELGAGVEVSQYLIPLTLFWVGTCDWPQARNNKENSEILIKVCTNI